LCLTGLGNMYNDPMRTFSASVTIRNPAQPERQRELSLTVDTGSLFTWIAAPTLRQLGVQPAGTQEFKTIAGAAIERHYGYLIIAHEGRSGAMNVVFAEPGEMEVLGVTALETMRLAADPVHHTLTPVVAMAV
jgi:predicted aspartyl protease